MKILEFQNDLHWFDAAAHLLITRQVLGKEHEELVAAGLIDVDQVTRGLAARALKGEFLHIRSGRSQTIETRVKCDRNQYRLVHKPIGKVTHTLIIHKSAVDDILEKGYSRTLVIPEGGNIEDLFARRFASDFSLPYMPDWAKVLWEECVQLELVQQLNIWTDPDVEQWRHIQAYQMSLELTEERAKEVLSNLLSSGAVILPEGITDAPSISERLGINEDEPETKEIGMAEYLQEFAGHLSTSIEYTAKPVHDLDQAIAQAIATMQTVPFLSQAHVAQAAVKGFKTQNCIIVSADMGVGKSLIALSVAKAQLEYSSSGLCVLMLVPAITIPKWINKEIKQAIPNAIITQFRNWKDVVRWREKRKHRRLQKGQIEFVMLGRDTAKLGMPTAPSLIHKDKHILTLRTNDENSEEQSKRPIKPSICSTKDGTAIEIGRADKGKVVKLEDVWLCPECYAVQTKTDDESVKEAKEASGGDDFEMLLELKLGFDDLASFKHPYEIRGVGGKIVKKQQPIFHKNVQNYHCSSCSANLSRDIDPEKERVGNMSKRRLQPSWFIQRYLKNAFDLLVVDELHEYRNLSGQGISMGQIAGAAKNTLALTGTLSTGVSSSLYYLLWRLAAKDLLAHGYDHRSLGKWISNLGAQEVRTRYGQDELEDTGIQTRKKDVKNAPKEIPGLAPQMFAQFLFTRCLFLELGDLGLPLVELKEEPIFVEMDDEPPHRQSYTKFHNALDSKMKASYRAGNKRAYAKFIPAVVNATCQPHLAQSVDVGSEVISWTPTHEKQEMNAKERRLLAEIRQDLADNRRCVVFVRYSGNDYQQDVRIYEILTHAGINVRLLKASVPPQERVAWLEKAENDGVDVIVSQSRLVEVGIDLMGYPSIYFFQFPDQINGLRQAGRRAWRVGQKLRCSTKYLINQSSYEMIQFRRMMKRRVTALLLEGRADSSDLASFAEIDDVSSSTFSIMSCLGNNIDDLDSKWKNIADKDIPDGVVMLKEEDFKAEIEKAMKRLAAETRRAAGLPDIEPLHLVSQATDESQLDLFSLVDTKDTSHEVLRGDTDSEEVSEPLTVGDLRERMGLVVKAKKRGRVSDDQIVLFAL